MSQPCHANHRSLVSPQGRTRKFAKFGGGMKPTADPAYALQEWVENVSEIACGLGLTAV